MLKDVLRIDPGNLFIINSFIILSFLEESRMLIRVLDEAYLEVVRKDHIFTIWQVDVGGCNNNLLCGISHLVNTTLTFLTLWKISFRIDIIWKTLYS